MSDNTRNHKISLFLLAFILWIATVVLGVWNVLVIRGLALRTYLRFLPIEAQTRVDPLPLLNALIMVPLTILLIGVVIGGAEYHRTRIGQPSSWKMFSRVLAVELSGLLLVLFI